MRSFLAIVLVGLIVSPTPAWCWWDEGHQVVARIAVKHLTPVALQRVAELLEVEASPEAVAEAMAAAATWADQVKGETKTEKWHFLNLALQDNRANLADRCANDECVTAQIRLFAAQLKASDGSEEETTRRFSDVEALKFVVHFVGDLHQPLHVISDADLGGNCEVLDPVIDQARNVHGLWDGPLVSRMGLSDVALAADLDAEISALGDDARAALTVGEMDDWAWEYHRLAMVDVYKPLAIPKEAVVFPEGCGQAPAEIQEWRSGAVDDGYLDAMQPVVREQLKKARLRLARLLNEVLG